LPVEIFFHLLHSGNFQSGIAGYDSGKRQ